MPETPRHRSLRGSQRRWLQGMRMRQPCGFPFFPEVPHGGAKGPKWSCYFGSVPLIAALRPEDTAAATASESEPCRPRGIRRNGRASATNTGRDR